MKYIKYFTPLFLLLTCESDNDVEQQNEVASLLADIRPNFFAGLEFSSEKTVRELPQRIKTFKESFQ